MKIAFFELPREDQAVFKEAFKDAQLYFFDGKLNEHTVEEAKSVDAVCVFVVSHVNQKVIDAMPNLKFIATRSMGFDGVDHKYAESKGIKVSNVPAYGANTVSEFAFGLILSLSRKIITANDHIRGTVDFHYNPRMQGFDLAGKTLGVIGTGKIGKNMVKIGKALGMQVVAYDLFPDQAFGKEFNFEYKSFEEVIGQSDIVTLHAPYTKENYHLINDKNIPKFKKGAYIVNTARGELIDTPALIAGLKSGQIGGAGLDVLEDERNLKENRNVHLNLLNIELMKMPNVVVTPHMAFYTKEAVAEILRVTIANLRGFMNGEPINLVK